MTPEALAGIHALCFDGAPRAWSAAEFAAMLEQPRAFLCTREDGFAIGRVAGPEAELLTLAVHPGARRRGAGRALLAEFEARARERGAEEAILEVAETNGAARALYAQAGYQTAGVRRGYYAHVGRNAISALVLRKPLGPGTRSAADEAPTNQLTAPKR